MLSIHGLRSTPSVDGKTEAEDNRDSSGKSHLSDSQNSSGLNRLSQQPEFSLRDPDVNNKFREIHIKIWRDTAFWQACKIGDLKSARNLLREGADVNVERTYDFSKRDPYHLLEEEEASLDIDIQEWEVRQGSGGLRRRETRFFYAEGASQSPRDHDIDEYRESDDESQQPDDELYSKLGDASALFVAIREDRVKLVLWLLDQPTIGYSFYTRYKGETVLHKAVGRRLELVVQKLLVHSRAGRLGEIRDNQGKTPFELAVVFNDLDLTRIFLADKRSRLNASHLGALLIQAICSKWSHPPKNVTMARLLLINGANVNYQDTHGKLRINRHGSTALHYASFKADVGLMKLLLAWKADKTLGNKAGYLPRHLIPKGRGDAVQILKSRVSQDETPPAWSKGHPSQYPASRKFNVDITFSSFTTPKPYTWSWSLPVSRLLQHDRTHNHLSENDDSESDDSGGDEVRNNVEERKRKKVRFVRRKSKSNNMSNAMRWIHLPNTNLTMNSLLQMTWVKDVVIEICHEYMNHPGQKEHQYYTPQFVEQTRCAQKNIATNQWRRAAHVSSEPILNMAGTESRMSLVAQFVDFETERYLMHRAGSSNGLTPKQRNLNELEIQFAKYDGFVGLQLPETFDQWYYENSATINERNTDQVVYKWFKAANSNPVAAAKEDHAAATASVTIDPHVHTPSSNVARDTGKAADKAAFKQNGSTLVVGTILTASPPRWDDDSSKETLFETISRSLPPEAWASTEALIQQILLQCLRFPEEFEQAGVGYHILDIFESWIAKQQDWEASLFREFRKIFEKDGSNTDNPDSRQNALKITDEVAITYELKDALEELFILKQLFTNQLNIAKAYHSMCPQDENSISLEDFMQQSGIAELIDRVDRLAANAKMVLENVRMLATEQGVLANKQATLAHEEAKRSRKLNNYVLLLTFVTIVFTPLAFMIGMFAVPIEGFPRDDEGEPYYESSWITGRLCKFMICTLLNTSRSEMGADTVRCSCRRARYSYVCFPWLSNYTMDQQGRESYCRTQIQRTRENTPDPISNTLWRPTKQWEEGNNPTRPQVEGQSNRLSRAKAEGGCGESAHNH
ncbi:hypothetical protein QBC36DRAFT_199191 [Triangularia setosa]|uniref:Ankyrin repeat protein n=1 Tax=Triangularia setosa TaxID=2587417 RepID=A0AAN7A305_9PEZI|nr:hypothetical protein QBC36DRAFT_199191 [Podospora setosa]